MPWVIQTDNYDRSGEQPGYDEKRMFQSRDGNRAATIAKLMNDELNLDFFYKVVPDEYKLLVFTP